MSATSYERRRDSSSQPRLPAGIPVEVGDLILVTAAPDVSELVGGTLEVTAIPRTEDDVNRRVSADEVTS